MKLDFVSSIFLLLVAGTQAQRISNPKTPPVEVRGNAFFANGKRFYLRGIDYQPGGSSNLIDPISDPSICRRDIPKFKELGVNAVRIYTVDNSKSHEECMKLLADNGIYLALDVNSPAYSLNRENEGSIHASYNEVYLQNVFATVDTFQKYDNTLLFFSANEVINEPKNSFAAPYIKAVTRDIKSYMRARNYRQIPVGYSAADVQENRYETATYMNCGGNDARSDFFGFNDYSWCSTDFIKAGWDKKVEQYKDYSLPIFLSEYGCNENPPRDFGEVAALYSDKMTSVYSGGLVYEYSMEANKYGIVTIEGNTVTDLPDFTALKSALAKTPAPAGDGGYKATGAPSACPAYSENWQVRNNSLPLIPEGAKALLQNGAGTGKGLVTGDKGSQWAGKASAAWGEAGSSAASTTGAKQNGGVAASIPMPAFLAGAGLSALAAFLGY